MEASPAAEELPRPVVTKAGKFENPWTGHWREPNLKEVFSWLVFERKRTSGYLEAIAKPTRDHWAKAFPLNHTDLIALRNPPGDAIQAVWIGHASLLVQLGGVTFLTDPVFSNAASPLSFAGPRRLVQPPFRLDDPELPSLDFVVISHNHYDHLDLPSVRQLHKRFGNNLTWYVPLKLGRWFESVGISPECIVELDWWQQVTHKDTKVTVALVPAQHWSNRGMDRCQSLWGGYVVAAGERRFYFAGDTGYCPVFEQIGRKYGPFDLAAIPIGAYEPRWFMQPQHINPAEAVKIHKELRSKRSVGIHCCTFCLTDEPMDEPPKKLVEEAAAAGLAPDEFVTLQHGAVITTAGGADASRGPLLGVDQP